MICSSACPSPMAEPLGRVPEHAAGRYRPVGRCSLCGSILWDAPQSKAGDDDLADYFATLMNPDSADMRVWIRDWLVKFRSEVLARKRRDERRWSA